MFEIGTGTSITYRFNSVFLWLWHLRNIVTSFLCRKKYFPSWHVKWNSHGGWSCDKGWVWVDKTVTCNGWWEKQHQTFVWKVIANSCLTLSSWTSAIYLKTAVGYFRCPTQTVRDKAVSSDVITTTYRNQLQGLMGRERFTFSLCKAQHRCTANVCTCFCSSHTLNKTRLRTRQFVRKKTFIFFFMMDPMWKISSKIITKAFFSRKTNPNLRHLMPAFDSQRT